MKEKTAAKAPGGLDKADGGVKPSFFSGPVARCSVPCARSHGARFQTRSDSSTRLSFPDLGKGAGRSSEAPKLGESTTSFPKSLASDAPKFGLGAHKVAFPLSTRGRGECCLTAQEADKKNEPAKTHAFSGFSFVAFAHSIPVI